MFRSGVASLVARDQHSMGHDRDARSGLYQIAVGVTRRVSRIESNREIRRISHNLDSQSRESVGILIVRDRPTASGLGITRVATQ